METFVPLQLGLIDEGRFEQQANFDLNDMQTKLLNYLKTHGDAAKGAKAKLTIEITLGIEKPADKLCSIRSQTKMSLPQRPPSITVGMGETSTDDQPRLFVRNLGSDKSHPKQGKFCTDEGKMVSESKKAKQPDPAKTTG